MKRNNGEHILNLLRENGAMSQADVARKLYGKSGCIPRVRDTLKRMESRGEIIEVGKNPITYALASASVGQEIDPVAKYGDSALVRKEDDFASIASVVAASADRFYCDLTSDPNGRYRSWEHCFVQFGRARKNDSPDFELLSLHLAWYLASWGMLRGGAFLLQKDYRVHIPAVKILLEKRYDPLFAIESKNLLRRENSDLLFLLSSRLEEYYDGVRKSVKNAQLQNEVSETLITKILLGTLGCVPAYDRYFKAGVRKTKVASGNFSLLSVRDLARFYQDNLNSLETVRNKMTVDGMDYPQMKILDMGFWQAEKDKNF